METAKLYKLIAQLHSENEEERYRAAYELNWDKRAIPHLIGVLRNRDESPRVRGQAAENLRNWRKRKVMRALVEASADPSAQVRFWSVFALGSFVGRRKMSRATVGALEARLGDLECEGESGFWHIGLEALAMLENYRPSRLPYRQLFMETILAVMRDPLRHPTKWHWANCYWQDRFAGSEKLGRALHEAAIQKIVGAGFEPFRIGPKLFPNAERREDPVEDVVGGGGPGDGVDRPQSGI